MDVSFSESLSSWNLNWNLSENFFIINNCISNFLFGIHRSFDFFFSNNWGLNDSLFDYWLGNNSLGNDRLTDNFSLNLRLRNDFLSLHNLRSWVKDLIIITTFHSSVLSLIQLSCKFSCSLINRGLTFCSICLSITIGSSILGNLLGSILIASISISTSVLIWSYIRIGTRTIGVGCSDCHFWSCLTILILTWIGIVSF